MSEIYELFLTGILIFAFQQVLLELWIKPIKEFNLVLKKLESFLIHYAYLSQPLWGQSGKLDGELEEGQDKMREYAGDLVASYSSLLFLEKLWLLKVKKYNILEARRSLIRLSNLIGNKDEGINLRIEAASAIDNIKKCLNFNLQ